MKNLEITYFNRSYHYRVKFVNRYITIIRFSKQEKRVEAYRNLVFKMMKDIVKKNIYNYLNLLQSVTTKEEMPTKDELIAECFIIFDKCLEKYEISRKNNFYFYFNKSLSRRFFKEYQRTYQRSVGIEITEAVTTVCRNLHENSNPNTLSVIYTQLHFTPLEIRICESKIAGEKVSDFLKKNEDVTNLQYSNALKRIKKLLIHIKQKGEI